MTTKHVPLDEMNAAIEMERRRVAPEDPLATFRRITGKACRIRRKNKYTQEKVCDCKVDWREQDEIQERLKAAGIWTNACGDRIILPKEYWAGGAVMP